MATLNVEAAIDSYMEGITNPDTNYGTADHIACDALYLGGSKTILRRGIGNFDVSALAGATINAAQLEMYIHSAVSGTVGGRISRCTRPSTWTEGGVTWNKYDGSTAWTVAGGDFDDAGGGGAPAKVDFTFPNALGWFTVTGLLTFVTDALASRGGIVSIIVRLQAENPGSDAGKRWRSLDYGSLIWRLAVDYTPAAGGRRRAMAQWW